MKTSRFILGSLIVAFMAAGCGREIDPEDPIVDPVVDPSDTVVVPEHYFSDSTSIAKLFTSKFVHEGTIGSAADVRYMRWLIDAVPQDGYDASVRRSVADIRCEFVGKDYVRFASESDGYALSFPRPLGLEADFTVAKYAQKFVSDDIVLRVTAEHVTPYTPNEYYYGIYTGEWLTRYIANKTYVTSNGFSYYENRIENDETILPGYSVTIYSINAKGLDKPYYKFALIRPVNQWSKFGFIVFKAKNQKQTECFLDIVKSFRMYTPYGTSKNFVQRQEPRPNPDWNSETKAYYQKLLDQKTFDFGAFTWSMCDDYEDYLETRRANIAEDKDKLEAIFGRPYDIMPTYTALGWYDQFVYFPSSLAKQFAGGNGFNDKPVLQFTFQITMNNNYVSSYNTTQVTTPMFNVLRGKYDSYFRTLCAQIKSYGKPILFRLNNEMNSDWTSYCGMMTLCDPEIFIDVWRYIYDFFKAEKVNNCIWIFNPIADTCPYSNWGEDLAYYPGNDYVQILGATNYEMGNSLPFKSFRDRYKQVYDENNEVFGDLPWIIAEFACGCGGATSGVERRYAHEQAEWVKGMFDDFVNYDDNPYLKPFKGGVWFDSNDEDGEGNSTNYLKLDPRNTETMEAFTDGFKRMYGAQ